MRLLGFHIDKTGGTTKDQKQRLLKAKTVWRKLYWRLPKMGLRTSCKGTLVQAAVVGCLLYGCEIRSFTRTQQE